MIFGKTILTAILMVSALAGTARADKAMLVLDGSGSMLGQIDGKSKIEIARGVIGEILDGWPQSVELGLIAYGHREKGSCADIQALVPVGAGQSAKIKSAVKDLSPKGKTPLTDAVKLAAKELRSEEGKATVILVSDGLETCEADPCAVASELEKSGVDFTVHVVGFGTTSEENQKLKCLADNTGGKLLGAGNAAELKKAMTETVKLVEKPTAPEKPATTKKIVQLKVSLGWLSIENARGMADVQNKEGKSVAQVCTGCGRVELPAGSYSVIGAGFKHDIDLTSGEHEVVNAATMVGWLSLSNSIGMAKVLDSSDKEVGSVCTGCGSVQLPPGAYKVKGAGFDVVTNVEAGKDQTVDVSDIVGWIAINNATGMVDVQNASGASVGQICSGCGKLQLTAGDYKIKGAQFEADVQITAGEDQVIDIAR
jgi:Mg-chelatase subunit ChlD